MPAAGCKNHSSTIFKLGTFCGAGFSSVPVSAWPRHRRPDAADDQDGRRPHEEAQRRVFVHRCGAQETRRGPEVSFEANEAHF